MNSIDGRDAFEVAQGTSRRVVQIICSRCGARETGSDKPVAPIDLICKHFERSGWRIHRAGSSATCPKCQDRREPPQDETAAMAALDRQRSAEEQRQAQRPLQSAEAIKAQARLFELLDGHLTPQEGTDWVVYDEGWDDAKVAATIGLSVGEVVRVREALHGRIENPKWLRLEQTIAETRAKLQADAAELVGLLDAFKATYEEWIAILSAELEKARRS